jgi:hypothetical protein
MADQRPFDFNEFFRDFVTQWERDFDALANRLMGTEEYSRSMNEVQRIQTRLQKSFSEFMGEQLANFNVPSRSDVIHLGESLQALDARIARVERLLQDLSWGDRNVPPARIQGPPRTKQPPGSARAATEQAEKRS